MGNLKDAAEAYEKTSMKNISELDVVKVGAEMKTETLTNSDGEDYKVDYIEVDGVKYRVPAPVKGDLKAILTKKPGLTEFCVSRVGTTKEDTKYTTIPL